MLYEQDWFMRQIKSFITFLIYVATGKKEEQEQLEAFHAEKGELYIRIMDLVDAGDLCQAENLLYEAAENGDRAALSLGLHFYRRINEMTDQELQERNFSREEIMDGLRFLCKQYDLPIENLPL